MESIGNNIKSIRKKIGLTQEELALQIGVTPQAISRWENGTGLPDVSLIVPLAKALSVSTDKLFGVEENKLDDNLYIQCVNQVEKIKAEAENVQEAALATVQYMLRKVYEDPDNEIYSVFYVEQVANLSIYVDFHKFALDKWPEYRELAIKYGSNAIRFSNSREWIERAHFALAWIYIHDRNYAYAREHIDQLPSVASNRLQESILAQLASFESGVGAMKDVLIHNLQNFVRAINKENMYAMQDYCWHDPLEAVAHAEWSLGVIDAFSKNKYMIPYCRGFERDIYKYLIFADVHMYRFEDAAKHFEELKERMEFHYNFYQELLADDEEKTKFCDRDIRYMEEYTREFIAEKQQEVIDLVLEYWKGEQTEKFLEAIKEEV